MSNLLETSAENDAVALTVHYNIVNLANPACGGMPVATYSIRIMTHTMRKNQSGTLYVVATPIGNLEDITLRATRILGEVNVIASEDTRHTRKLLSHLGISTPQISYYKDKEASRSKQIVAKLLAGLDVALVSDAGTPGISDPGHILVEKARENGIRVVPVPGPSSLTAAISAAGLMKSSFIFLGFLPARAAQRRTLLKSLVHEQHDLVFYESPHRLISCLKDCFRIFGDREAFWARELTKLHEELHTSTLSRLAEKISSYQTKGESVLIIQGADKKERVPATELKELLVWHKEQSKLSLKDSVRRVADDLGISRSLVYKEALKVWQSDKL